MVNNLVGGQAVMQATNQLLLACAVVFAIAAALFGSPRARRGRWIRAGRIRGPIVKFMRRRHLMG